VKILNVAGKARVLFHLLEYAVNQFGNRIPGQSYRQRGNSERIDNYQVEIDNMMNIYSCLINVYTDNKSLGVIDCNNIVLPYYEKMLEILKPWSLCLDLDTANRVDSLNNDQIEEILESSSEIEQSLGTIYEYKNEFITSESHFQRAISYAKRCSEEGETKTTLLLKALESYSQFRITQGDFEGALLLAEEAYNYVAIAYNPVHPQVQKAAGVLINCLIHKGDLYDAERFAQVTLDNLRDPANDVDQESEEVARGYYNLGCVIDIQNENFMRAEMLSRVNRSTRELK
jgi:tetratricopeptide (TPR) repeat protein